MFQVRRYFTFALARWKLCRIENMWKFAAFNLYTVPAKISYIQRYSTDFEIFALLEDFEGGHQGGKFQVRRCFPFCNGKAKTWRIDNIWNFAAFNLFTVTAKILYLQMYSSDFRNLCLSSKMLRVGIWVESFMCAGSLLLPWQGENFAHWQHLKFCHFQPVLCASKNPNISKGIQPIFEIFASARRCWGWAFGWNVSGAQVFYFCTGKVKTLRIENMWKFAAFNLYRVPAKISYIQRYSTDFRNLCPCSKILRVDIREKVSGAQMFPFLQWQSENLAHRQHLKFCHFQPVHCHSKNPVSPKVFIRFSKSLPQLEDVEGRHLGGKFHGRR